MKSELTAEFIRDFAQLPKKACNNESKIRADPRLRRDKFLVVIKKMIEF
jgi:hypothetical protein